MLLYGPDFQIPVLVKNFTDAEAEVASLSENVDREDMTPVMEAEGAARVLARANGDRKEAARRLGWSPSKLDDRLKLMSCSSDVRKALDAKVITLGLAEMLSGLTKEKQDEVLAGFAAAGKYPTAEECKPQIMAMTKSLTVAIFDTPSTRPVMCSEVSAVHRLLCATRSPVRLSNSTTAGARSSSASNSLRHSSSSPGNVIGVPRCGVAKAVISSHR